MIHVATKGGGRDKRIYRTLKNVSRKHSGIAMCGESLVCTAHTQVTDLKTARHLLEHAAVRPNWLDGYCPQCLEKVKAMKVL